MATWSIKPGGGGDFTSCQAANDSGSVSTGDTLSLDEDSECQAGTLVLTKGLSIVAGAGHEITAPTQAQATSKARIRAIDGALAGGDVNVIGIGLNIGNSAGTFGRCLFATDDVVVRNCVFNGGGGGGGNDQEGIRAFGAAVVVENCAFFGFNEINGRAILVVSMTCDIFATSILTYSGGTQISGIFRFGGTATASGTIIQGGDAGSNFRGTVGGDYNVSEDATAPGAGSQTGVSGSFTTDTVGSEDLALTASNAFVDRTGFPVATDLDMSGASVPSSNADPGCLQFSGTPPSYFPGVLQPTM